MVDTELEKSKDGDLRDVGDTVDVRGCENTMDVGDRDPVGFEDGDIFGFGDGDTVGFEDGDTVDGDTAGFGDRDTMGVRDVEDTMGIGGNYRICRSISHSYSTNFYCLYHGCI